MNNANEILFRCSSLGYLMAEPREKSPYQKWADELDTLKGYRVQYDAMANKETKTAINKLASIQKKELLVAELEKHKDDVHLAETVKTHLVDVYVSNKYNRFTEISAKQLDKGNEVEEDSITVISRLKKTFFKKNEVHLSNNIIKGTPDLFEGENIYKAEHILDAKSSWDCYSFNRAKNKELNENYYWQGTGYMMLTGASKCTIGYCLNNTPYQLVVNELRKESYKYADNDTPAWVELQIIANHVYDKQTFDEYINLRGIALLDENDKAVYNGFVEIPLQERYFEFTFERNPEDIERLTKRIYQCRNWMNENLFKNETN